MKQLENLWGAAQKAVSSTVDATVNVAADAVNSTTKAATDAMNSSAKAISGSVGSTAKIVSSTVESTARLAIDTALDTKDSAIVGVVKGVGNSWDAVADVLKSPLVGFGVSVGMWIAPVPVGVGVGILWLLDSQMKGSQTRIEYHVEETIQRRTRERVVGLLQKYGEIPETAVIKTAMLNIQLNSKSGEVTGDVIAGDYKGQKIENQDFHGLFLLIESCGDDTDSRQVLEALENHRKARLKGLTSQ
jgi:hypothetical protein